MTPKFIPQKQKFNKPEKKSLESKARVVSPKHHNAKLAEAGI